MLDEEASVVSKVTVVVGAKEVFFWCCTPLHEEYSYYQGYKGDLGVTPEIYGAIDRRAQMIRVWMRALDVVRVRP